MKQRLITGFFFVLGIILLIVSRFLTPFIFDLGIGAFAVLGAVEVARVFERSKRHLNIVMSSIYPAIIYLGVSIAISKDWNWLGYLGWYVGSLVVYFLLVFAVNYIFINKTREEMKNNKIESNIHIYSLTKAINTIAVCIYPTMLFSAFFMLNHMEAFEIVSSNSLLLESGIDFMLIISVFAVQILTDSLAMVVGSTFKGPKLCPIVSPKKTISGAIGGVCGGVIGAMIVFALFFIGGPFKAMYVGLNLNIWYFMFFGFVGAVLCQCGDILASYLKRKARVKDYGTFFPGHGGVMDRVDGLIFVATFALIFLFILA